tara:strand:+ start:3172 stop:4341 length:1170 start_codon:yes stop_codon:yes gene_type:complete
VEKQKICIIGGGLAGLVTAITLSKLNVSIDLITGDLKSNAKSYRTTAISQENYNFLKKLNINKFVKNNFWPCSEMKLYTENSKGKIEEIFKLQEIENKKILYMTENSKMKNLMIAELKKNRLVKFIDKQKINEIDDDGILKSVRIGKKVTKYNLVILCVGSDSVLVKNFFKNQLFKYSYGETSITTIVKHNSCTNNIARQFFLNEEIIAFLPVSNTRTSIVWSVKKKLLSKYNNKVSLFKKKISLYSKEYLKNVKSINNLEEKDLNFLIRSNYYKDRILLFGDTLHQVHPLAGQGFNMILRDLISLKEILQNKINLGLDIGTDDLLSQFSNEIKPRNFIYSIGIDLIKFYFSIKKKSFKNFRNRLLNLVNKSNAAKKVFFDFADKGIKF